VIVKVAEYTKRFLKGIVFEEEMDEDPSILFYYLGPIAEIYKGKK
jgi:hypothetical protein